ncbi:SGNH/GDSL hydrolase family protein [Leptospira stimsonii]|uniref:SGNH/GDSL hydrolase family protein n=1 Tax=Leptospira stimsonii TaxID=2202203 RepID=A0ABY2N1C8_9LEPT|nr:SGNH/GDSL hydrolase family protein [Leptospira stimsonii]TGK20474.1 SGNH/GDSL hydrolase family protein [Leptospira stimsonii]TGM14264.1 SGNH/GDSL hydrolase family protein [Leptospira stimsonii]
MKLRLVTSIIFLFLIPNTIFSEDFARALSQQPASCDTASHFATNPEQPDKPLPFVTFFGDSLGDFVDLFGYGIYGWSEYLNYHHPEVQWRIQNFAVGGWTTVDIYDAISRCLQIDVRNSFLTSNHVAFEAGGNDVFFVSIPLAIMPWKLFSYPNPFPDPNKPETAIVKGIPEQVAENVRGIIRLLRHPQVDKDVLLMGNFPTLSWSPSMGHMGDYFNMGKKLLDDFYLKDQTSLDARWTDFVENTEEYLESLYSKPYDPSQAHDPKLPVFQQYQSSAADWYVRWLYIESKSPTTILSIALGMIQPFVEAVSQQENEYNKNRSHPTKIVPNRKGGNYVHFLPLYNDFLHPDDCNIYFSCFVGHPPLYRDFLPGHVNMLGYAIWSRRLSDKILELGWDQDTIPRNGGVAYTPPGDTDNIVTDIPPHAVDPTPVPIDLLILVCLLTGKCW